jgi:hypothetical protein
LTLTGECLYNSEVIRKQFLVLYGKGPSLILLVFFFPLAVYLLILGSINRRRYPLMVSGTWDFIGILFAASGLLFCGGPAALHNLNDRFPLYWQYWLFLSILYFGIVVGGAAFLLWWQRRLTSIYNVEPALAEKCLDQVCGQLNINPARAGNLYVFGKTCPDPAKSRSEAIQPAPYVPAGITPQPTVTVQAERNGSDGAFLGQTAVLEIESFPRLRHVTLRWDPPDSQYRQQIEANLQSLLADKEVAETDLGVWLSTVGLAMMALIFLAGATMFVLRLIIR